jgi:hypothetical protein
VTTLPLIVQAASVREKSEPVTVTVVPAGPEVGFSTIAGGSTVKVVLAASAPGLPVTVIVYVPGAAAPTVNVTPALIVLAVIAHVAGGIPMIVPVPVTTHDVSVPENPVPLIVTTVPSTPELGARLMVGNAATLGRILKRGVCVA